MRAAIVLFVCAIASSVATADDHVPSSSAEALSSADLNELRLKLLVVGTRWVDVSCAHMDFIGNESPMRGSFLTTAFRVERGRWGAWFGIDIVSTAPDSYRYLTPSAGIWAGGAALTARSTGLYAANEGEVPGRTFLRDFDIDLRVATGAIELRGRVRDVTTEGVWMRDMFVGAGLALAPVNGARASMPVFVGIGARRVLWRDEPLTALRGEIPVADGPGWQALLWLEVGLAFERVR